MRGLRPGLRGKLALAIALLLTAALGATYLAVYRGTEAELRNRTEDNLERTAAGIEAWLTTPGPASPRVYRQRARHLLEGGSFGPEIRVLAVTVDGLAPVTNRTERFAAGSGPPPGPGGRGLPPGPESDGRGREFGHDGHGRGHDPDRRSGGPDREGLDDDAWDDVLETGPGSATVEVDDLGDIRLLTTRMDLDGVTGATVRVGQPLAPVETALQELGDTFLVVSLATLLLGTLAGWLLASTITRTMRRMAAVAENVDGGELSARMPVPDTRDEARRLAESFNRMLDRLQDAFERQRAFVADASHDLRTPLTVIRGQVEVLARNPDPSPEEIGRVTGLVAQATTRMEQMAGDLSLLAQSGSAVGLRLEPVELGPLVTAEVEGMEIATGRELGIGPVTGREVWIDREQVSRALANLIANAAAHSPADGTVTVSAEERRDRVALIVDDQGPGVPLADRERIFDRFVRLDESRSSAAGGSGLGLAIVKAVAESHGGRVRCLDSPAGGARFELELPLARPRPDGTPD